MEYIELQEDELKDIPDVFDYVNQLQTTDNKYKGYKVFNSTKGNKVVVISSGKENITLKVNEATKSGLDTSITVVETELNSGQANSYIVVKVDEIVGAFYVFERVQYDGTDSTK